MYYHANIHGTVVVTAQEVDVPDNLLIWEQAEDTIPLVINYTSAESALKAIERIKRFIAESQIRGAFAEPSSSL